MNEYGGYSVRLLICLCLWCHLWVFTLPTTFAEAGVRQWRQGRLFFKKKDASLAVSSSKRYSLLSIIQCLPCAKHPTICQHSAL